MGFIPIYQADPAIETDRFFGLSGVYWGQIQGGELTQRMMVTVMLLSSFVALFLLMAASTRELNPIRALLSATLCGLYAGACMIPAFSFFGGSLWRLFFLMLIGSIAFGIRREGIRQSLLFVFFQLTVSGILSAANKPFAAVLLLMGFLLFVFLKKGRNTVSVSIEYRGRKLALTAWRDTGNTLKDPVTGQPVLLIDQDAATELTGLTRKQLEDPVATMTQKPIPGLRLIPYHTVDRPEGMLLGLRVDNVRIGGRNKGTVVAFAPTNFGKEGNIRALTGGYV